MKLFLFFFIGFNLQLISQNAKPQVVVLGVSHSQQLINANQQPAAIRTFIEMVKPAAICIERSPEEYARNDFYEFTYEQQYLLVPYAEKNNIQIFPVDWYPPKEDVLLAFGVDNLEVPRFTRNREGFWGFHVYRDSSSMEAGLFYAEDEKLKSSLLEWYAPLPEKTNNDFARRLFLYRTFMQTERIQDVLEKFEADDTVLVVVGSNHKFDIENHLENSGYKVIQPSSYGIPTEEMIAEKFENMDAYAILSFNLLGLQSTTNIVNNELVLKALEKLETTQSAEMEFYKVRHGLMQSTTTPKEAITAYSKILERLVPEDDFSWDGVKDRQRIDSYFDPFGNLTLWERIHLELAREYWKLKEPENYSKQRDIVLNNFKGYKKRMLEEYMKTYIEVEL